MNWIYILVWLNFFREREQFFKFALFPILINRRSRRLNNGEDLAGFQLRRFRNRFRRLETWDSRKHPDRGIFDSPIAELDDPLRARITSK